MRSFIQDYLQDPSQAVAALKNQNSFEDWSQCVDEDSIYAAISTPEFHLYQEIILCDSASDLRTSESARPVA
jgi:hypothetical protein